MLRGPQYMTSSVENVFEGAEGRIVLILCRSILMGIIRVRTTISSGAFLNHDIWHALTSRVNCQSASCQLTQDWLVCIR